MYVSEEKFNALLELVHTMKSKLDLYEKYENMREKEFRELERDVYRIMTGKGTKIPGKSDSFERNQPQQQIPDNRDTTGTAWLR